MDLSQLAQKFDGHHGEVKSALDALRAKQQEHEALIVDLAQKASRRNFAGGGDGSPSIGDLVAQSAEYKALAAAQRGKALIQLKTTITSGATSGGPLAPAEQITTPNLMARRRIRIRDLIAPGRTSAGAITYPRQTTRTIAAATVAEGAAKPESALAFEAVTVAVTTLAHWVPAAKQILDDAPLLASIINAELLYGLADVEENQLLNGGGTGTDLNGIYTQATAYSAPFVTSPPVGVDDTMLDVLLLALAQVEAAGYEPDGIVLNPLDWRRMQTLKSSTGEYLGGGPFSTAEVERLWRLPVVSTTAMTVDKFLVGAFRTNAQVFDRQDATVEISTEDSDNFRKNLVTIRAEERLALAVYRTAAFVKGDFSDAGV